MFKQKPTDPLTIISKACNTSIEFKVIVIQAINCRLGTVNSS